MSVYVRCSSTDRRLSRIKERVEYVFDAEKTRPEFCHAKGAGKDSVYKDFLFIKRLFCKTDGRQYLHWILSHDKGVSDSMADKVAVEVGQLLQGKFQLIFATHTNTDNRHTHFLLNSVSIKDGKKFDESPSDMKRFRSEINKVLLSYHLNPIGKAVELGEEDFDKKFQENQRTREISHESIRYDIYEGSEDGIYQGCGLVEDGTVYSPGILYEVPMLDKVSNSLEDLAGTRKETSLIRGVTYDPEPFEVQINTAEGVFKGKGGIEDGKIYMPGVIYEIEED